MKRFFWDDELDFPSLGGCMTIALAALAAIVAVVFTIAVHFDRKGCEQVSEQTNLPTTYHTLTGCYVEVGDQWVPLDNWRGVTNE
jgi:hypothetical protein